MRRLIQSHHCPLPPGLAHHQGPHGLQPQQGTITVGALCLPPTPTASQDRLLSNMRTAVNVLRSTGDSKGESGGSAVSLVKRQTSPPHASAHRKAPGRHHRSPMLTPLHPYPGQNSSNALTSPQIDRARSVTHTGPNTMPSYSGGRPKSLFVGSTAVRPKSHPAALPMSTQPPPFPHPL